MDLLEAWARFEPHSQPFVLDADRHLLLSERSITATVTHRDWREAYQAPDFCEPGDTRLHLGLLPMPFVGDVRSATVYVLLLNPGLGPHDYYGESEVPAYRSALLANLKQSVESDRAQFVFLDPQFGWHGGFDWWHSKLAKLIDHLSSMWHVSFCEARRRLGRALASIELLPYHSSAFRDSGRWLQNLPSAALARAFAAQHVVSRVRSGEAIAIVTRKVAYWDLPDLDGIVTYSPTEARSAHLTPESPGGRAIIRHLR